MGCTGWGSARSLEIPAQGKVLPRLGVPRAPVSPGSVFTVVGVGVDGCAATAKAGVARPGRPLAATGAPDGFADLGLVSSSTEPDDTFAAAA